MATDKRTSVDEKHEYIMSTADSHPGAAKKTGHNTGSTLNYTATEGDLGLIRCLKRYRMASLFCILAAIGSLSDGYQVQMSGSIIALPGFKRQFGVWTSERADYVIEPQYIALWGSLKNVFAVLGAGIGSWPADKFGRRWMILAVQVVMIGSCVLEQLATHWTHWLGARFMDGLSIGLAQCCINVYISEMAPTAGRGALMSLTQLGYTVGGFLSAISLNIVSRQDPNNWRQAVLSQFAFCGVAIFAWFFIPESPRWHAVQGREAACKAVLVRVNGKIPGYDVDEAYRSLMQEIDSINVSKDIRQSGTYLDLFKGTNFRRLIISFLPWHWQVAIGVPIIATYSAYFFDMSGLSNPFNGTVATNCINIAMLALAVPLVERLGRRKLLLAFSPLCIGSLLIIGGVLKTTGSAIGPVLITFACVWSVGYSLSCGPMGYIYVAETATTRLRAKNSGVAVALVQTMATVYVYIAPIMLNSPKLGMSNTVFFFAGTGSMVYALVYFLVPETKGRSFAELDELFERRIPAWKFAQTECHGNTRGAEHEHEGRRSAQEARENVSGV